MNVTTYVTGRQERDAAALGRCHTGEIGRILKASRARFFENLVLEGLYQIATTLG
ncbi:MAG: hypothetical protein KF786_09855 [Burkholderiaceae bacterium]|nr:hypothetical protein [Burkholderiaceae bacterium]